MAEKDEGNGGGAAPPAHQMAFPPIGDPEAERAELERQGQGEDTRSERERELEKRMSTLEEERKAEREQWTERERRMQATLDRLAQQPAAAAAAASAGGQDTREDEALPDIELPDPVNDPKGFNKAVTRAIDQRSEARARQIASSHTSAQSQQQQLSDVWGRFQSRHSGLARHDLVVESVARREMERLRVGGGDPVSSILADPDGFVDRVAEKSREYLSAHGIDPDAGGEAGGERQPGQGESGERQPGQGESGERQPGQGGAGGRTAGIDGGDAGGKGGKGGKGGSKEPPKPKGFIDELKAEQVRSGFY